MKIEHRTQPYFGKFKYKASLHVNGASYTRSVKSIMEAQLKIEATLNSRYGAKIRDRLEKIDHDELERLVKFKIEFEAADKGIIRIEQSNISFFSDDITLLKELTKVKSTVKFTEVEVMPPGILYFKKDPPAKFRVYFTDDQVSSEDKVLLEKHIDSISELKPSASLQKWLKRYYYSHYLSRSYFIDYETPQQLTMLGLKFSNMIRKVFKLEKL